MKKQLWLVLLFLIVPIVCKGQMIKLDGVVSVQNSKINTGQIIYVEGVQIKHEEAKSDITDSDGYFSLQIVGVEPNTQTKIEVTPTGKYNEYIVVNRRDIDNITLGRKERINIYICEKNQYFKRVDELYNINRIKNDEKFEREIKALKLQLAQAREEIDYEKAGRIADSINNIEKIKVNMVDFIRDISEKMAQINLDSSNSIMQNAFTKISVGDLDSALLYIPIELIREKYLRGEILSNAGQKIKEDAIQLVLMKARLSVLKSFDEACSNYEEAIRLAPLDFEIILEYMSYLKRYNKYNSAKRIAFDVIERCHDNEVQTGIIRAESLGKVYFQLGNLMSEEGDFNNSDDHFKKAAYYFQILNRNKIDTVYIQKKMEISTMLGQNAMQQKNWNKAETYMHEALSNISENEYKYYAEHTILTYFLLGELKRNQSNFKDASFYYEKALSIYKLLDQKDVNTYQYALLLSMLSLAKVENFEYNAARNYINEALKIIENKNIESLSLKEKEDCAGCYMLATQCFERLNEISKAKHYWNKGIQIITKLAESHPQIYADTYFSNIIDNLETDHKEGEEILFSLINKYTTLAKEDYALFEEYRIILLFKLATYYETHNNTKRADEYYREALKGTELLIGTNPVKYYITFADLFYHLGNFYLENKDLPAANLYFEKGISYYNVYAEMNPMGEVAAFGNFLSKIGEAYTTYHEYVIADKYLKQSAEILSKLVNADHTSYAIALTDCYHQIATNYVRIALSDSALVYRNKALDIQSDLYKKYPSVFDQSYIKSLVSSASAYRQNGNIEISESLLQKSLDILQAMDSIKIKDYNNALYITLLELAECKKWVGNYKKAKHYFKRLYPLAKEIYAEGENLDAYNYMVVLNDMGQLYNSMDEYKAAQRYLLEGIDVYNKSDSNERIQYQHGYIALKLNLGVTYLKQKKLDTGKNLLNEVIREYEELYKEDKRVADSNTAYISNELGLAYLEVKDFEQAYELLTKSLNIKELLLKEYDNNRNKYELFTTYKDLALYYQQVNNLEKSIDYLQKSHDLLSVLMKDVPSQYIGHYLKNGYYLGKALLDSDSINQFYNYNNIMWSEIEEVADRSSDLKYAIVNALMAESNLFRTRLDNIEKAIEYLEKGMLLYKGLEEKDEVNNKNIIDVFHHIGVYLSDNHNSELAETYFNRGLEFIEQLDSKKQNEVDVEKYLLYSDLSILYFSKNYNIEKAISLQQGVIDYYESKENLSDDDIMSLVKTYSNFSYWFIQQKAYDKAESLFSRALLLFNEDTNHTLYYSGQTAKIYVFMGYIRVLQNDTKSEDYFRKAINIFEYNYKIDPLHSLNEFTPILMNIPNIYLEVQNDARFEEYVNYILKKSEPVLEISEYSGWVIKIVDELKKLGKLDLCEKYTDLLLTKLSAIDENTFIHNYFLMYLNSTKAQILVQNNKPMGEYLVKAMKSYSIIDYKDIEISSLTLVGLIFHLISMDKTINEDVLIEIDSLSNNYKDQVLNNFVNEEEEQRVNSVQLLHPLADFYLYTFKDPVKAKDVYITIISEIEKLKEGKTPNDIYNILMKSCESLGAIYYSQDDYEKAEIFLKRALKLLEDISLEIDNLSFKTEIKNRIIGVYVNTKRYDEALILSNDILSFLEAESQKSAQHKILFSWSLANHANIYFQKGDHLSAIKYYTKAVNLHNEVLAVNPDEQYLISDLCAYYQQLYINSYILSDYQTALVYVDKHLEYLTKHSEMTTQEYINMKKCDRVFLLLVLNQIDNAKSTLEPVSDSGINTIRVRFYHSLLYLISDEKEKAINILNELINYIRSNYDNSKDIYNMIVEQVQILHRNNSDIHDKLIDDYFSILKNELDIVFEPVD